MTLPDSLPKGLLAVLKSPGAGDTASLVEVSDGLQCTESGRIHAVEGGIPILYSSSTDDAQGVTHRVKKFYEENPFPGYEGLEEFGTLVSKGRENPFARNLLESIGYNKRILECGCGTGQMSHYLQLNNNQVLGVDMSLSSLRLAQEHKRRNGLTRCLFSQMNLYEMGIKDESFDVVISHGVLHHTPDPREAFLQIVRKARRGGIVMVGLYNRLFRIPTWVRARLIPVFGERLDPVVRKRIHDPIKASTWIADQYYNPHESWHTIDDVLGWFEEADVEFLNCYPPILDTPGEESPLLFGPSDPGGRFQRLMTQVSWLWSLSREGSLFDVIGRRM